MDLEGGEDENGGIQEREHGGKRSDPKTRKRVDEIAVANEKWRKEVEGRVKSAIRWAYVGVGIAIAVSILGAFQWQHTRAVADDNNRAICAYRDDLDDRVKSANEFLKKHPEGLPGIATAAEIRDDTANRERAADSFRSVNCS